MSGPSMAERAGADKSKSVTVILRESPLGVGEIAALGKVGFVSEKRSGTTLVGKVDIMQMQALRDLGFVKRVEENTKLKPH